MSSLSVARRELQAASRRRATFRIRLASAALTTLIAAFTLVGLSITGAAREAGAALFGTLVFLAFAFAGLAGVFLAADAISEERRDGTLGLLFLTPLSGFAVVLGKLSAVGLNALYGLIASFPIIASAWFLGGVTAGEFWRTLLVLANTLFLSLAVALRLSAGAREQSEALARTAIALLLLLAAMPLATAAATRLGAPGWLLAAGDLSPTALLQAQADAVYQFRPGRFWRLLGLQHVIAWALLFLAGWSLQGGWRDRPEAAPARTGPAAGTAPARRRLDPTRLDSDPVRALLARGVWVPRAAWALGGLAVVAGLAVAVVAWRLARTGNPATAGPTAPVVILAGFLSWGFVSFRMGWRALFAWEACSFFAEARRTGALDLMLTTPVTDAEILGAQRRHLRRTFVGPVLLILAGELVAGLGVILLAQAIGLTGQVVVNLTIAGVGLAFQYQAMARAGAWYALSGLRATAAFGKTLVFGSILPSLLCCLGWFGSVALATWAGGRLAPGLRKILAGDGHGSTARLPRPAQGPTQR